MGKEEPGAGVASHLHLNTGAPELRPHPARAVSVCLTHLPCISSELGILPEDHWENLGQPHISGTGHSV